MTDGMDVVFTYSVDSWSDSCHRGFYAPADRLVLALLDSPLVDRLLVADPFRSAPIRAARHLLRQGTPPFPARHEGQRHVTPLRLRRSDPTAVPALRTVYRQYDARLAREAARLGMARPAVVTGNPFVAAFAPLDWASSVTLYFWDDWAAWPPGRRYWPAFEAAYVAVRERAVRVCAVSDTLIERLQPEGPWAVVPNGVEPDEWREPWQVPAWFRELPGPRLLYVGTIDDRLDVDGLRSVARRFPNGSVVLVGFQPDPSALVALTEIPNVVVRPPEERRAVAGLVHAADVCLLLHRRTRLTQAMSPLKLFEYLAGGAPVVATALRPVVGVDPRVVLVHDGDDPADAVEEALDRGRATEEVRRAYIADNAWSRRHQDLLRLALGAHTAQGPAH